MLIPNFDIPKSVYPQFVRYLQNKSIYNPTAFSAILAWEHEKYITERDYFRISSIKNPLRKLILHFVYIL